MVTDMEDKKKILYVLHGDFAEDASNNLGGTQLHVRNLVEQLKNVYHLYVLARDEEFIRLTDYGEEKKLYKFSVGELTEDIVFFDDNIRDILERIMCGFHFDLVHIHHTVNLSFDVFEIVRKHNIPMVCTIHDFYYICPSIKLLDETMHFCSSPENRGNCQNCLKNKFGQDEDFLVKWQEISKKMLGYTQELYFPSNSAKEIMEGYYPELSPKMKVIPHGLSEIRNFHNLRDSLDIDNVIVTDKVEWDLDEEFGKGWALLRGKSSKLVKTYVQISDITGKTHVFLPEKHLRPDVRTAHCENSNYSMCGFLINGFSGMFGEGDLKFQVFLEYDGRFYTDGIVKVRNNHIERPKNVLKVGFLGGMVPAKGSRLIQRMIESNTNKDEIMWYIVGTIGDKEMAKMNQENLVKVGTYSQETVKGLLQGYGIDLICLLPLWAETFSYTLSEAIISEIPVLATDIGAISERIRKEDIGFLVDVEEKPEAMVERILHIWNNEQEVYQQKKKNMAKAVLKSVEEMAGEYRKAYDKFSYRNKEKADASTQKWKMQGEENAKEIKIKNPEQVIENLEEKNAALTKQLIEANDMLQKIYGSLGYKIIKRIPFLKPRK